MVALGERYDAFSMFGFCVGSCPRLEIALAYKVCFKFVFSCVCSPNGRGSYVE